MDSRLFVSKYQLYLPNREELRREIENVLAAPVPVPTTPSPQQK
jgi:hypothetical protein